MNWNNAPIDALRLAAELRKAAAELRERRVVDAGLAQRLERRADAVLFPDLPRWWADDATGSYYAV